MDTAQYNYLFKYIMVGDTSVGKSTLLGMFVDNRFRDDSQPTLGVQFASKRVEANGRIVKLQIWDTVSHYVSQAGQQAFRTITRAYYKNTVGILLVFDVNNRQTWDSIVSWINEIQENAQPHVVIVLVGNKTDINKPTVSEQQIKQMGLPYFLTSAKTGENVNDPFMQLTQTILANVDKGFIDVANSHSGVKKGSLEGTNQSKQTTDLRQLRRPKTSSNSSCSC